MKFLVFFILLISSKLVAQPARQLGLKFDDDSYEQVPLKSKLVTKDRGDLPTRIDLSAFIPSIGDQGDFSTCVGFATTYYLRTILENQQSGITDLAQKDKHRYSPAFTYNAIKDPSDLQCQFGSKIDVALEFLKQQGAARLSDVPYPSCSTNSDMQLAASSRIAGYSRLFDITDPMDAKIDATKKGLAEGNPVAIGMQVTASLSKPDPVSGLWSPDPTEKSRGGHALCVVGYDNNKFGGAFRIVNSWSSQYGDNGYFWVKYTDYAYYARYGYEAFPLAKENPKPAETTLSATLEFQLTTGTSVPVAHAIVKKGSGVADDGRGSDKMVAYTLKDPQSSGTQYKFFANVGKQAYLYVISTDLSNTMTKLFPYNASLSPIIGANTRVMLPSETKHYFLDQNKGTDYWLFLFSDKELNIDSYIQKMSQGSGAFADRIMTTFGTELVDYQQVAYKTDQVGFELKGNPQGSIVPLLVSLQHVQ